MELFWSTAAAAVIDIDDVSVISTSRRLVSVKLR
jgi:hypothetical protein